MINSIENSSANVSLATVDRLAAALGVTFTRLVRAPDATDNSRIEQVGWKGRDARSRATLLGAAPGALETEFWLWTLAPGETFDSEAIAGTWHEMIFVLEGTLSLVRSGSAEAVEADDFRIFSSSEPYQFRNDGEGALKYLRTLVL
jgi:uncharacterized cupin superfamily protein